jgi:hypothetical protein
MYTLVMVVKVTAMTIMVMMVNTMMMNNFTDAFKVLFTLNSTL